MNLEILIYAVQLMNLCSAAMRRYHLKHRDQRSLKDNQIWDFEPPLYFFLGSQTNISRSCSLHMLIPFHITSFGWSYDHIYSAIFTYIPTNQPHFFFLSDQSCHCPAVADSSSFQGSWKRLVECHAENGYVCFSGYLSDYLI